MLTVKDRFEACILAGAIGDAWGSSYENAQPANPATYYWGQPPAPSGKWELTDDTQLTLAACEALQHQEMPAPEAMVAMMLRYYRSGRFSGLGASTLKALQELSVGAHWSQAGRTGEYAAGNGAAMRIAPYAFLPVYARETVRDICRITHRNDEAYVGALAVVLSIRAALDGTWDGSNDLLALLLPQLPDTSVRDRLLLLQEKDAAFSIADAARLGTNGYVVNSVPLAVFAASRVAQTGMHAMFEAVIGAGGDTDTNAAIAGQIAGALTGTTGLPATLLQQLQALPEYGWLQQVLNNTTKLLFN
ncbi:ADP-ribosylglycohydrolase family protein [Chitinophaga varians]|uniref:ADP-ribosylglycohydrolase family protein n=1 Tax=Chitinophaga varians TaxID=2202339 RepID=UPI00165F7D80|nr:ADP-ribosylglycohydrolase family protein [Chitinophaga varians]MBC9909795.1 ADP-ribosylglycohydrolase family protein [Chitinophaga varians]